MTTYTMLVVDDEPNFRSSMRRLFHLIQDDDTTFTVLDAAGGEEALKILGAGKVDCVLMDYQMPGGNGIEWIRRMLDANANAAVIMVTGLGNEQVAVEAMKRGAADYLVKGSITPETLLRTVMNAVQKIRMRLALEEQRAGLMEAERQRVMLESLGAACHHLGQPATVITAYLHLMKDSETSPERMEMIENCLKAAEALDAILHKLQMVSEYRTEPYYRGEDGDASAAGSNIIAI